MRRCLLIALAVGILLISSNAPVRATTSLRWAYYDPSDPRSLQSLQRYHQYLDVVSPAYWRIQPNGTITSSEQPEVVAQMRAWGLSVVPMVQKYSWYDTMQGWIANPAARKRSADQLAELVVSGNYDGIHIDIENIRDDAGGYLSAFMDELADRLRPRGKSISIALPARTFANEQWYRAFDYTTLGQRADMVVIMAYDYGYAAGQPAPVAPLGWVRDVSAYTLAHLPPEKVLLGIPFYGYDWNLNRRGLARYIGVDEIVGKAGQRGYDANAGAAWLRYAAGREQHMVWYENWQSVQAKWAIAEETGVKGWAAWRLGYEDPAIWTLIQPRR